MNNVYVWVVLVVASITLGIFSRIAAHGKEGTKTWWFFEVWRDSVSYFITGIIGYFLVAVRWTNIAQSGSLTVSDFILCAVFIMGALGSLPYFIRNITQGINAIITKVLK